MAGTFSFPFCILFDLPNLPLQACLYYVQEKRLNRFWSYIIHPCKKVADFEF
ncbi:hypothetical protein JHK82_036501 [Glycine max]|nr:hypothetical protein JHK86_036680 [Glycine max]KAG5113232.1 hypothetical protein JHK82_036501 [Glycine max]KAG5130511.1 hypothetical protein JHK84_036908 [Glycine max]KHN47141.1 hypothetical protein glysoja_022442 [Glycine soja]